MYITELGDSHMLAIVLDKDEKGRLIEYLSHTINSFTTQEANMTREAILYKKVLSSGEGDKDIPDSYIREIKDRHSNCLLIIQNTVRDIRMLKKHVEALTTGGTISIDTIGRSIYGSIYQQERRTTAIDSKYNFYPRLKKAKEANLYVFRSKIKSIMESEHVKIT